MGKISNKVPVYNGERPYIFISYSHRDTNRVLPVIEAMEELGYRIWFDQGIEAGSEWSNNIARHLRDCEVFVSFVSEHSMASENCLDEIAFAKSNNKPSLMIFLEENVELPSGVEMQTARFQRMLHPLGEVAADFVLRLQGAGILSPCRGDDVYEYYKQEKNGLTPLSHNYTRSKKSFVWMAILATAIVAVTLMVAAIIISVTNDRPNGGQPQYTEPPKESSSEPNDTVNEPVSSEIPSETTPETPSESQNETEETDMAETPAETEPLEITMSEELEDLTFILGGKVYTLPMSYADLAADGWMTEELSVIINGKPQKYVDKMIGGHSEYSLSIVKNGNKVFCCVYNPSGDSRAIKDCVVISVSANEQNNADFVLAKEIKVGASMEAVRSAYGIPNEAASVYLLYKFTNGCYVRFGYNVSDNAGVEINAKSLVEDEYTETREERPAYLESYVAPEELGSDVLSGNVRLFDGMLINLPVPLYKFIENGWTVAAASSDHAVSLGQIDIKLTKEGKNIKVSLKNYADYQTSLENCAVVNLIAETDEYAPEDIIELPGGLKFGMDLEEVKSCLPIEKFKEYDLTSIYSHFAWYSGKTTERMQKIEIRIAHKQYNLPERVLYYIEIRSVWIGIE